MVKVLLIVPSDIGTLSNSGDRYPLGALYIAAVLKDEHKVKVVDMNHSNKEELVDELESFNPEYVGISFTTPLFKSAMKILSLVKKVLPSSKTIAGGPHPSSSPESCKDFDYVVKGEGEKAILKIVGGKV